MGIILLFYITIQKEQKLQFVNTCSSLLYDVDQLKKRKSIPMETAKYFFYVKMAAQHIRGVRMPS